MDFQYTKDQLDLREQARHTLDTIIEPMMKSYAPDHIISAELYRDILKQLKPLGYLCSTVPREFGGMGLDNLTYGILLEELARSSVLLPEIVPPRSIFFLGTEEQKQRWLPGLLAGERISTAAITEPLAGSDVRSLQTRAIAEGDHFVINGIKKWIMLGGISDMMTVLAVTDPDKGVKGTSRFLVERETPGFESRDIGTLGYRNIPIAEITFNNCRIPKENLLGIPGEGIEVFHRALQSSRAFVGLQCVGLAQAAIDASVEYARERSQFGRPIGKFQLIQEMIAEMTAVTEAARLICYRALSAVDSGRDSARETSMAKFYATEVAGEVTAKAMEIHGAAGISEEKPVERYFRNARMWKAADGTNQIQKLILGREIIGLTAFV